MYFRPLAAAAMLLSGVSVASAGSVTLDFNGFPDRAGGLINGTGMAAPIRWEKGAPGVTVDDLQPNGRYSVDFFHNSGKGASDFTFTMNDAGSGVASVSLGGETHNMLDGFKPGDATLKLRTFDITYNANRGQTGKYWIAGLFDAYKLKENEGPQVLKAIPGTYNVDMLANAGGQAEDFTFIVNDKGNVGPFKLTMKDESIKDAAEYAEFDGSSVSPRAVDIRFRIVGSDRFNLHATHARSEYKPDGNVHEFILHATVGGAGVNIWSFGQCEITASNVKGGDGEPLQGHEAKNDGQFRPYVRYDAKDGFYFAGVRGFTKVAEGVIEGQYDGDKGPLKVTITAEIVEPENEVDEAPTTQPG